MIFIKLIYLLFFGAAYFVLYSSLNGSFKINRKWLWWFGGIFVSFVALHIELFAVDFLMPRNIFFPMVLLLLVVILFHFIGRYFVGKTKKSNRLTEDVKAISIKMGFFVFLKAPFILGFILYSLIILSTANWFNNG